MKRIKINPDQLGLFDIKPKTSVPQLFSNSQNCGGSENTEIKSKSPVGADWSKVSMRQPDGRFVLVDAPDKPVSRFSGGVLSAVESHRILCGKSIDISGILMNNEYWCQVCLKYLWVSLLVVPLYRGNSLKEACYKCKTVFYYDLYEGGTT